ncbi:hypothetical protein BAUCODRAFT_118585 [Baudoinia panamericana UAMH 10762]|uniref:Uncharacterized protein n=1 Tax=Baudoinia panamericana (strain UAMH 10762) TaxID=717646 RepID=M2NMT9_BAUPA|nr:uncharacterized protein BAUCODRAFT_118585 [Baudoinia panamericana UAMH 10762]EMD00855.1 hypothetical protein BAUCODRAFT_118585 [Baudoinia panamericana UAMH 10762]
MVQATLRSERYRDLSMAQRVVGQQPHIMLRFSERQLVHAANIFPHRTDSSRIEGLCSSAEILCGAQSYSGHDGVGISTPLFRPCDWTCAIDVCMEMAGDKTMYNRLPIPQPQVKGAGAGRSTARKRDGVAEAREPTLSAAVEERV